jgi:hypothetical protein
VSQEVPVIFIGSGEASRLECKVMMHSIRKHTPGPVDIRVFNGTHNTVERDGQPPEPVPMSLRAKYRNITEFSNYRFLIPQLCGHQGRAIWVDSDMICLTDIRELFELPMNGADLLAKTQPGPQGDARWGLSVALYDCSSCRFDLEAYFDEIDQGLYGYNDLHQMSARFLARHPLKVGALDGAWNAYDQCRPDTRILHYTNLHTQPWKHRGHPFGALWFDYFQQARDAGAITQADIDLAVRRSYVRPDIAQGNTIGIGRIAKNALSDLRATVRDSLRRKSA